MVRFIAWRILTFVPIIVGALAVSFLLLHLSPGSPALYILGETATPEDVARVDAQLGLDQPFLVQFGQWTLRALGGDFGTSVFGSLTVGEAVSEAIPATMSLALVSIVFALLAGLSLGLLAGLNSGSPLDRLVTGLTSIGLAIPSFWLGVVVSFVFGVKLGWFPIVGFTPIEENPLEWFRGLILPALCLGLLGAAVIARHTRTALLDTLSRDYIRTARAKGLSPRRIRLVHVLKNAAVPIVTLTGLQFIGVLGGTVIVESIFGISGIGRLIVQAAHQKDIPIIQGIVVYMTVVVLVVNLIIDVAYAALDPRMSVS